MSFNNFKIMHSIFNQENGFTIIELVISIFILAFGIVGIFNAFSIVAILTAESADRLTATYLAQEGMEIVRNIRDTNWINGTASTWTYGLTTVGSCGNINNGCEADYTATTSLSGNSKDHLYINADGFYVYNTSNAKRTKFERKILIMPITDVDGASDHIIKVTVQVSWDEKATILNNASNPVKTADTCSPSNCITTETTLYNWYNYINH